MHVCRSMCTSVCTCVGRCRSVCGNVCVQVHRDVCPSVGTCVQVRVGVCARVQEPVCVHVCSVCPFVLPTLTPTCCAPASARLSLQDCHSPASVAPRLSERVLLHLLLGGCCHSLSVHPRVLPSPAAATGAQGACCQLSHV